MQAVKVDFEIAGDTLCTWDVMGTQDSSHLFNKI